MAEKNISDLHHNAKDLTKQRFGRLTAIEPTDKRSSRHIIWLCQCDCGNICEVNSGNLGEKGTKSCGCLAKEKTIERSTTHRMSNTSIYRVWRDMIRRCENPKREDFERYGGRGISVCERWHSFENFYADVDDRPEGMTLDRPNNNGNYGPDNWRWATIIQQNNNQRDRKDQHWFFAYNENIGEWDEDNNQSAFARRHNLSQAYVSYCLYNQSKQAKGWKIQWLF